MTNAIVTVFRSRLNEDARTGYEELVPLVVAEAEKMPGFVSRKSYIAEDGERLSLVEFSEEKYHQAWANNELHVLAKRKAKESFYSEFHIQVCKVTRESKFER